MSVDSYDLEGDSAFAFTEKSVRMGFIRKVYGLLSVQLVITFGLVAIIVLIPQVKEFVINNPALFYSALGITFAMIIILACCGEFRRKTPHNFIALILFTICEGYLLGCASATFDAWEVMVAIGATIVVALALTVFAFQTKWDFTLKGGMLYVSLIMLIIFGIFGGIFHNQVLNILYACIGALIFSAYIVFDTQLMLGGSHKLTISPEEYVFAALNLYLDVVNLFLYLLIIFSGGKR